MCSCGSNQAKRLTTKEEYTMRGWLVRAITYECKECGEIYDERERV